MVNQNKEYQTLVSLLEKRVLLKQERGIEIVIKKIPDSDAEGVLDPRVFEIAKKKFESQSSSPMPDLSQTKIKDFPIDMIRAQMGWPNTDVTVTDIHKVYRNIEGKNGTIPIRIYSPNENRNLPAVLYFHGGGFIGNTTNTVENPCKALAEKAKAVIVSVDYRLAPENPFPVGLTDCYDAVRWVFEHAKELNVNRDQIAVSGDSAGGNLATVCAMMDRDLGENIIKYQALIYPGVNLGNAVTKNYGWNIEDYLINDHHDLIMMGIEEMKGLGLLLEKLYLQGQADVTNPYVSPLLAEDLSKMPETLIVTAEFDFFRLEGEEYARKLARSGVQTRVVRYNGMDHTFIDRIGSCPQAEDCMNEIAKGIKCIFS